MTDVLVTDPMDGVRELTLNRPRTLNAFTPGMLEELSDHVTNIGRDPSVRAVVLTGAGRGFCSGADRSAESRAAADRDKSFMTIPRLMRFQRELCDVVTRIRELPQPVIAAINGPVAGGGIGIALAADIRIAAEPARFVNALHGLGGTGTEMGIAYLLQRTVGAQIAADMVLTNRSVSAAEALTMGLVCRVVSADDLVSTARTVAAEIAVRPPFSTAMTKSALWTLLDVTSLRGALELESRNQVLAVMTSDAREFATAQAEGRQPVYSDR